MARKHIREFDVLETTRARHIFQHQTRDGAAVVGLTWKGLALTDCGRPILTQLHKVLRLAVERFLDPAIDKPSISKTDLLGLGFSKVEIDQLYDLLHDGIDIWRGITGQKSDLWSMELSRGIRDYQSLETVEKFLDKLREPEQPLLTVPASPFQANGPSVGSIHTPNTAFILMWMASKEPFLIDVCQAIKDCCTRFAILAQRADDVEHQDVVMDVVLDRIRASEYVICDLTGERPNVYYELGYAHAIGKRPVLLRRAGTPLHFDIQGYNVIEYADLLSLRTSLLRRLEALTGRKPLPPGSVEPPQS